METSLLDVVVAAGRAAGLDAVGAAPAEPFRGVRVELGRRDAAGLRDSMQFTYRRPEVSTDPAQSLPDAATLVVGARSFAAVPPARPEGAVARVAQYAWADHYGALRDGLGAMAAVLSGAGHRTRVLCDDNALVDREAAVRAGLGWYGKNSNVLLPERGSQFVLGSVLTDFDARVTAERRVDGCGACAACIAACPTAAIVEPGVIDAGRCLAWLVQRKGVFPREHRVGLGDRIYGCDDCQDSCPVNRRAGEPAATVRPEDAYVDLVDLLASDDASLLERHGRWYIPRRDPAYLRRNALLALGNVGDPDDPTVVSAVAASLLHDDDLVRAHAVWAALRLGLDAVLDCVASDASPLVRRELELRDDVVPR